MARTRPKRFARLRVMADYDSSGVWAAGPIGPFRHGMVSHAALALPADLAARFDAWIEQYGQRPDAGFRTAAFNADGLALARALKRHVGPATEVVFAPEADDGHLLPDQTVGDEPDAAPGPAA